MDRRQLFKASTSDGAPQNRKKTFRSESAATSSLLSEAGRDYKEVYASIKRLTQTGRKRRLDSIISTLSSDAAKIDAWLHEEKRKIEERRDTALQSSRKALQKRALRMRQAVPKTKANHLTALALIKASTRKVEALKQALVQNDKATAKELDNLHQERERVAQGISNWLEEQLQKLESCSNERTAEYLKLRSDIAAKLDISSKDPTPILRATTFSRPIK